MINLIKNYINHPKFVNETEEQTAHFLAVVTKSGAMASLFICIIGFFAELDVTFYATLGLFLILTLSLIILRKKYIIASSLLTLSALLVVMMITSYAGDGIHDVSILILPGIIIIASYLLNRKVFALFTIISIGAIGIVRILRDMSGKIAIGNINFPTEYFTAICILAVTAIGIRMLINNLLHTLERSRKSEQKYRNIFDNIQDVYFELDTTGIIIEITPSVEFLLSYKRNDLVNHPFNQVFLDKNNFENFFSKINQEKSLSNYELNLKSRDDKRKRVSINAMLIKNDSVDDIKIVGSIRDITEKKNLEDQLLQSQKLELIGKLAGGIAHDFNNLLTVINGHCEIALDKKKDYHENLLQIQSASEKAAGLTKQLLAFSRKQLYQPLTVNPNEIISELNEIFRRLLGENIEIKMDLEAAENLRIKADPSQMEQILLNLLVNARDAIIKKIESVTDPLITIKTDRASIDKNYLSKNAESYEGTFFLLSVSDNGVGIEKDIQEHVFEPFFTTKEQGTGLGLSTVYGIVKQSNGFINIYSEPGVGTTLNIYWPVTEEKIVKPDSKIDKAELRGNEHILLVEDDSQVREFTKKILENYGYSVDSAVDGVDGLRCYKENQANIDILVTDMIMPKMNGVEMADAIRQENTSIKVLYISGYADNHVLQTDLQDEKIDFLQKPFTTRELLQKIRSILDKD